MNDQKNREYELVIDPKILKFLGPSLYTNIYYVLAELIANAYDAGAKNVYIIQEKDTIIVEDDGFGMSPEAGGDIDRYLNVAVETRTSKNDSYVKGTDRKKMGRKGIGKLAALAVSENVFVMTRKSGIKSGFILSRNIGDDHKLKALNQEEIIFRKIGTKDGTSIVMTNPQYELHKTTGAIKNNLLKIFPSVISKDFIIHIISERGKILIDSFEKEMVEGLGALILFGEKNYNLSEHFNCNLENREEREKELLKKENTISIPVIMNNKYGEKKEYDLKIKGWVGAYRSTRGLKKQNNDFPDSFISLISNGKLGEFNIIPSVGMNKLQEVYVTGQLHVDLFEETELPDMALSNRQGYKDDDPRYKEVLSRVKKDLLPTIVEMRRKWGVYQKSDKDKGKYELQKEAEENLQKKVDEYKKTVAKQAASQIADESSDKSLQGIQDIIESEVDKNLPDLGLKREVDSQKKRILISHAGEDKALADIICKMLSFNNISDKDILYTNSDNEDHWIPEGSDVLDYLRDFFVDSRSTEKIFIVYITSETMVSKWCPILEVGAMWITQSDHKIFDIKGKHKLEAPLDTSKEWHTSILDKKNNVFMSVKEFGKFIIKIIDICETLGYKAKSKVLNEKELGRYVSIT